MSSAPLRTALAVGLDNLKANPLRTVLSTLGVVVGVAALVAVLSLGDGMERYGSEQIREEGLHMVTIAPVEAAEVDGVRIPRDSFPVLTSEDAAELARSLPPGARVSMQMLGSALVSRSSGNAPPHGTQVIAMLPLEGPQRFDVVDGRMFTREEALGRRDVALLTTELAATLAAPDSARALLGRRVRFAQDAEREVIGLIEMRVRNRAPGRPGHLAIVPVDGAAEFMSPAGRRRSPRLEVHATGVEQVPLVRAAAEQWASDRWGGDWSREVNVASASANRLEQLRTATMLFKLFMGALTGISLVVGGIGIMNVLLASVSERTREIGIRKTTGARDRDILRQFLAESVVVSSAGSVVGAALGLVGAFGATFVMRMQTGAPVYAAVAPRTLLLAGAVAVLVGLVFGTYPARRAARLSPIDAIRHD